MRCERGPILRMVQLANPRNTMDWTLPDCEESTEIRRATERVRLQRKREAERRTQCQRVSLEVVITGTSATNFFVGLSENVSAGGVFVSTLSAPSVGAPVELRLKLGQSSDEDRVIAGVVRWHRLDDEGQCTGCGVEFLGRDEQLAALVAALAGQLGRTPLIWDL